MIVPKEAEAEELIRQLRFTEFPRPVLRRLQRYSVTVRNRDMAQLRSDSAVEMIRDSYPVLRNMAAYGDDVGLCVDAGGVWDAEGLIA